MRISYGTDVGMARHENQDSVFVKQLSDTLSLLIVADGMGGYEGGKLASSTAINTIAEYMISEFREDLSEDDILRMLQISIQNANKEIYAISADKPELNGMGTTVVASIVSSNMVYTASVGDSRGYLYTKKKLKQITRDHSLVYDLISNGLITKEEARLHPQRNVITRAVGSEESVLVDTFVNSLEKNDIILLCSDGLYSMMPEELIQDVLKSNCDNIADKLITLANDKGGKDNITVIAVKISDEVDSK